MGFYLCFSEINYNFNERVDQPQPSRIPYIPIMPEPFPYPFDEIKNIKSNEGDKMDLNNSISIRQRREADNGGLDDNIGLDYMKPMNFQRPVAPKVQEVQKVFPSFHVTYWMFYPYSQVNENSFSSIGPIS